ncbi:hypothetical protein FG93_04876 [Bosea sp. LC85]|uniref:hypothetical protein n=1 Tax=Bosea sp. LC85 TaxID=1502851 RepID=UPI0004E2DE7F|nr:hypothetical protein [Bosea sp. LC85]KFC65335.1 hypothetical protein FG93_04876 [Bosea sp. LC85]
MTAKGTMICVAFIAMSWAGYSLINRGMQRDSLPLKLRTGWFYAEGSCSRLLSHQGAFVFSLSKETVETIKSDGMSFFEDIDTPENRASRRYFSGEWKETPVPASYFSDGMPPNLHCGHDQSWLWPRGIAEALKRPGGYYQSSGIRSLYVLPELGLVVASASDR